MILSGNPAGCRRPLRIVAVSPVYWPCVGGGERLLGGVLEHLVQRGHRAKVLAVDAARLPDMFVGSGSGLPLHDWHNGVEIQRIPRRGGGVFGKAARAVVRPRGLYRVLDLLTGGLAELAVAMPSPLAFVAPMRAVQADVVITANREQAATVQLHDLLGRLVHQETVRLYNGTNELRLGVKQPLPAGIYQLTVPEFHVSQKVAVQ